MDISEMKKKVVRALHEFSPIDDGGDEERRDRHSIPPSRFPVPELVLFGLRELLGFKSWGPGEKLRWGISAKFKDVSFSITLEKFGVRLYTSTGLAEVELEELLQGIGKAAAFAESWLQGVAKDQIGAGNVSMENRYGYFNRGYLFFRSKACEAYSQSAPSREEDLLRTSEECATSTERHPFRAKIQGGYLAGAMVDAYFSKLDHLFVLSLPFLGFDPREGRLVDFVNLKWGEKWNIVFGNQRTKADGAVFESLRRIKENVRNPGAHGGFARKGMSFYFHVEGIGALPAMMTKQESSFDLFFTRIPEDSFEKLCASLDQAEEFFANSQLEAGLRYAESGLSIDFSREFLDSCKEVAGSKHSLEEFIERRAYLTDYHANMEY